MIFDPHPLISVGPITATAHGLFFALGALAAMGVGSLLATKKRIDADLVPLWTLLIFAAGLVGARIAFVLAYPSLGIVGWEIIRIWSGGLLSFGGWCVGACMAGYLLAGQPAETRAAWIQVIMPSLFVGWAIGRLGNYYAAESFGVASDSWSLTYGRVPIQLFESLGCLLLGLLGVRAALRSSVRTSLLLVPGYFALRFLVDFWRDESVVVGLRNSQWTSLLFLSVIGLYAAVSSRASRSR